MMLPQQATVKIGDISVGNHLPMALIAGPCQIENLDHALMMAEMIGDAADRAGAKFIYKSSFDKANRTSLGSARGVGIKRGLDILSEVKERFRCPVLTDVHEPSQCSRAAMVADILQIPALLCRQTDLLVAAGNTGAVVNIKKGQFLAPADMKHAAAKVASTGNNRILLCERGSSFGYGNLVVDFRSLPIMAETGYPVVFDASHSVQLPGGLGGSSGGERRFIPTLARAAVAAGVAALFIETHNDPDTAPSDGASSLPVTELFDLLMQLREVDQLVK